MVSECSSLLQALFRGFQVRKQYKRIVWSVGVLEKAILRWRLKRKGFRGLQVQPDTIDPNQESDVEEEFFRASRKQAEDRVERSVVKVQAMFRSKRAQEEYRRIKLEHNKATVDSSSIAIIILQLLDIYSSSIIIAINVVALCSWNTKDFFILMLTWGKDLHLDAETEIGKGICKIQLLYNWTL